MNLPTDPLLTIREIADRFGVGKSTVFAWVAAGHFPKPIKIGKTARWRASTVEATIRAYEANHPATRAPAPTRGTVTTLPGVSLPGAPA